MNTKANFPDNLPYDKDVTEVKRMKEECDRMIHEMLTQIGPLLDKIDAVFAKENENEE